MSGLQEDCEHTVQRRRGPIRDYSHETNLYYEGKRYNVSLYSSDGIQDLKKKCFVKLQQDGHCVEEAECKLFICFKDPLGDEDKFPKEVTDISYLFLTRDDIACQNNGSHSSLPPTQTVYFRMGGKAKCVGITSKDRIKTVLERIRDVFPDETKNEKIVRLSQKDKIIYDFSKGKEDALFMPCLALKDVEVAVTLEAVSNGRVHFVHNALGKRQLDYEDETTLNRAWELFNAESDIIPREVRIKSRSVFARRNGEPLDDPLSMTFKDCQLKTDDIVEFITDCNLRFLKTYKTRLNVCRNDSFGTRTIMYSMGIDVARWKALTLEKHGLRPVFSDVKNVNVLFHHVQYDNKEYYRPLYDPEPLPFIENGGGDNDLLVLFHDVKFLDIDTKNIVNTDIVYPWTEGNVHEWTHGISISCKSKDAVYHFVAQTDGSFYHQSDEGEKIIGKEDDPLTCDLHPLGIPDPNDSERETSFFIAMLNSKQSAALKKKPVIFRRCRENSCPVQYRTFCKEFWYRDLPKS